VADRGEMVAALDGCDLVVFDSSRAHTSALGLAEDKSDDYAKFSLALIDPLARAGIATLILDNTGWEASDRPRGSTSKIDLCDVVLLLECPMEFGLQRRGRLRLTRKLSRLAEVGEAWDMELGAGAYGAWTATGADARRARAAQEAHEAFRTACVTALEDDAPLGRDALLKAARGCGAKGKSDTLRTWLTDLASDPTSGVEDSPDGYRLTGVDPLTPAQGVRAGSGPPGDPDPGPPIRDVVPGAGGHPDPDPGGHAGNGPANAILGWEGEDR
jgi:hypothetical protein